MTTWVWFVEVDFVGGFWFLIVELSGFRTVQFPVKGTLLWSFADLNWGTWRSTIPASHFPLRVLSTYGLSGLGLKDAKRWCFQAALPVDRVGAAIFLLDFRPWRIRGTVAPGNIPSTPIALLNSAQRNFEAENGGYTNVPVLGVLRGTSWGYRVYCLCLSHRVEQLEQVSIRLDWFHLIPLVQIDTSRSIESFCSSN